MTSLAEKVNTTQLRSQEKVVRSSKVMMKFYNAIIHSCYSLLTWFPLLNVRGVQHGEVQLGVAEHGHGGQRGLGLVHHHGRAQGKDGRGGTGGRHGPGGRGGQDVLLPQVPHAVPLAAGVHHVHLQRPQQQQIFTISLAELLESQKILKGSLFLKHYHY